MYTESKDKILASGNYDPVWLSWFLEKQLRAVIFKKAIVRYDL